MMKNVWPRLESRRITKLDDYKAMQSSEKGIIKKLIHAASSTRCAAMMALVGGGGGLRDRLSPTRRGGQL
jgi:hypothetical protein